RVLRPPSAEGECPDLSERPPHPQYCLRTTSPARQTTLRRTRDRPGDLLDRRPLQVADSWRRPLAADIGGTVRITGSGRGRPSWGGKHAHAQAALEPCPLGSLFRERRAL